MVELMHKFVPQSRIRIIQNECTRSTQLNPKAMFGVFRSVWVHFGSFHYYFKLGVKRSELVQLMQKFVPRSRVGIFLNERTRSTPLDPKSCFGAFRSLTALGIVSLLHETRCKTS